MARALSRKSDLWTKPSPSCTRLIRSLSATSQPQHGGCSVCFLSSGFGGPVAMPKPTMLKRSSLHPASKVLAQCHQSAKKNRPYKPERVYSPRTKDRITLHLLSFPDPCPAHSSFPAASTGLAAPAGAALVGSDPASAVPALCPVADQFGLVSFLVPYSLSNPGDQVLRCPALVPGWYSSGSRSRLGIAMSFLLSQTDLNQLGICKKVHPHDASEVAGASVPPVSLRFVRAVLVSREIRIGIAALPWARISFIS